MLLTTLSFPFQHNRFIVQYDISLRNSILSWMHFCYVGASLKPFACKGNAHLLSLFQVQSFDKSFWAHATWQRALSSNLADIYAVMLCHFINPSAHIIKLSLFCQISVCFLSMQAAAIKYWNCCRHESALTEFIFWLQKSKKEIIFHAIFGSNQF